jgi:putative phosphoesterase
MKIGLISDPHGNRVALRAVLDALRGVDLVVCAGDLTGYYTDPNGVISDLLEHGVQFIVGNHDRYLHNPPRAPDRVLRQSIEFTRSCLAPEYRRLLADSPAHLRLALDGLRIAMYHGSPWDPLAEYVYPDYAHFERFAGLNVEVVVLGHTHRPMVRRLGGCLLVNPGSCGQPRDGDPRASYAVLDTRSLAARIERVTYDIDQVIASVRSCGLDLSIAKALVSRSAKMTMGEVPQRTQCLR